MKSRDFETMIATKTNLNNEAYVSDYSEERKRKESSLKYNMQYLNRKRYPYFLEKLKEKQQCQNELKINILEKDFLKEIKNQSPLNNQIKNFSSFVESKNINSSKMIESKFNINHSKRNSEFLKTFSKIKNRNNENSRLYIIKNHIQCYQNYTSIKNSKSNYISKHSFSHLTEQSSKKEYLTALNSNKTLNNHEHINTLKIIKIPKFNINQKLKIDHSGWKKKSFNYFPTLKSRLKLNKHYTDKNGTKSFFNDCPLLIKKLNYRNKLKTSSKTISICDSTKKNLEENHIKKNKRRFEIDSVPNSLMKSIKLSPIVRYLNSMNEKYLQLISGKRENTKRIRINMIPKIFLHEVTF